MSARINNFKILKILLGPHATQYFILWNASKNNNNQFNLGNQIFFVNLLLSEL